MRTGVNKSEGARGSGRGRSDVAGGAAKAPRPGASARSGGAKAGRRASSAFRASSLSSSSRSKVDDLALLREPLDRFVLPGDGAADVGTSPSPSGQRGGEAMRALGDALSLAAVPAGAGALLQTLCDFSGVECGPQGMHYLPLAASAALCLGFRALAQSEIERFRAAREAERTQLCVVITGSTQGIGKALAREFLKRGDRVVVASRSAARVEATREELVAQTGCPAAHVAGVSCDVADFEQVEALAREAAERFGRVDIWVNNAGYSGSFKSFLDSDTSAIDAVVRTNLLGTMHGTKAALSLFRRQQLQQQLGGESQGRGRGRGHVFNMDGAGYDGNSTPFYAAYGATKAGITQLNRSLHEEVSGHGGGGVHTLSPGMVLTDLLLENSTAENRAAFNILAEQPETVAASLVPRMAAIGCSGEGYSGKQVRYLTLRRALGFLVNWHNRKGRFFDKRGNPKWESEGDRLSREARAKAREEAESGEGLVASALSSLQGRAWSRPADRLAATYALSFIGVYFMLAEIATAKSL